MTGVRAGAAVLMILTLAGCSRAQLKDAAANIQNRARSYAAAQNLNSTPSQTAYDGPSTGPTAAAKGDDDDAAKAAAAPEAAKPAPQAQPQVYYYEAPPPPAPSFDPP